MSGSIGKREDETFMDMEGKTPEKPTAAASMSTSEGVAGYAEYLTNYAKDLTADAVAYVSDTVTPDRIKAELLAFSEFYSSTWKAASYERVSTEVRGIHSVANDFYTSTHKLAMSKTKTADKSGFLMSVGIVTAMMSVLMLLEALAYLKKAPQDEGEDE